MYIWVAQDWDSDSQASETQASSLLFFQHLQHIASSSGSKVATSASAIMLTVSQKEAEKKRREGPSLSGK
jgi:hypothetical protein